MAKIWKYPFRLLNGLIDRTIAVLGAVGFAQFPQFFAQYLQRLGGHLAEAQFMLVRYELTAEYFNMTLEEYIATHLQSGHDIFTSSGQLIAELVDRIKTLENSFLALSNATVYTRWWVFLQEFDLQIVKETWSTYTPGIPTTIEGLIYGACGLIVAWLAYNMAKAVLKVMFKIVTRPFTRRRRLMFPAQKHA
ncbi:MAG: DUF2937 family protein [Firmicutes bacterium]|nr:DUF2937 family protein [Bacillota bacterium]